MEEKKIGYPVMGLGISSKAELCIKANVLSKSDSVQKNIELEKLMDNCMFFSSKVNHDGYVPLDLGVTIRDKKTGKVMFKEDGNIKRTFIYLTEIPVSPHRGYDLVMFLSSIAVFKLTMDRCTQEQLGECMLNSVFDVNGLLWLNKNLEKDCLLFNPMIMTTILVDAEKFEKFIPDTWKFLELEEVKQKSGLIKGIVDDLVDFKDGGDLNEHDYN